MMAAASSNDPPVNECLLCCKTIYIYAIGECNHPICYECSTRMRVICGITKCPICRQELHKVIFTNGMRHFHSLEYEMDLTDTKFQIFFETTAIVQNYRTLLEHACTYCRPRTVFRTFEALCDHMKYVHDRYYCSLCVRSLKLFTAERRNYTSQELHQHMINGDPSDKSQKGHPLCGFCRERYLDVDELLLHLQWEHLLNYV